MSPPEPAAINNVRAADYRENSSPTPSAATILNNIAKASNRGVLGESTDEIR